MVVLNWTYKKIHTHTDMYCMFRYKVKILPSFILTDEKDTNIVIGIQSEFILNLWGQSGRCYTPIHLDWHRIDVHSTTNATGKVNWIFLNLSVIDNERKKKRIRDCVILWK